MVECQTAMKKIDRKKLITSNKSLQLKSFIFDLINWLCLFLIGDTAIRREIENASARADAKRMESTDRDLHNDLSTEKK